MKRAPLHLSRLGNDVTARLENKPGSIAFVCPQGKGVPSASLRGVIPLSLLSGHPGPGFGVFCLRMRKGYEGESPQAVTKQTLRVLWHLVAGAKKGERNVPRYSAVHKGCPTGSGFSLPRKRTDVSGQFFLKGNVFPESRSAAGSPRSCSMGCGLQGAAGELSELDLAPKRRNCGRSSEAGARGEGTLALPGATGSAHGVTVVQNADYVNVTVRQDVLWCQTFVRFQT